jgi:hypothetical protein
MRFEPQALTFQHPKALDKSTTHRSTGRKTKGRNKQRTSGYLEKLKKERGLFKGGGRGKKLTGREA